MGSDMNLPNQQTVNIKGEQRQIAIDANAVGRTLKKLTAPVFDFFVKTEETNEENPFMNYESEIQKVEMKSAVIQRIMNDSDPTARKKFNVVI